MRNSYVSNHVHIVFATKSRLKMISEELQPKLWAYMAGIAKNHNMHAVAIGGTEDHGARLADSGVILRNKGGLLRVRTTTAKEASARPVEAKEWSQNLAWRC